LRLELIGQGGEVDLGTRASEACQPLVGCERNEGLLPDWRGVVSRVRLSKESGRQEDREGKASQQ
jgi:hypothetical protein